MRQGAEAVVGAGLRRPPEAGAQKWLEDISGRWEQVSGLKGVVLAGDQRWSFGRVHW